MIGYVTLGTNDLPRAAKFYDALLADLGAKRVMEGDTFIAWGLGSDTREACDAVVRVPIYGKAESLNLAMAATVCLYASAAVQRAGSQSR